MVKYPLSLEDFSFEEQTAVTQLKQRMIGLMNQEMFEDLSVFIRFVRARDLNVNAAEAMLKKHLHWRKMMQIDTILTDYTPKEVIDKYLALHYIGNDKEGNPVIYLDVGNCDPRGILKSCRKADAIKCIVQRLERFSTNFKKQSYKLGKLIDKWSVILNCENLSFAVATHKITLETIAAILMTYEANYPERLKTAYILNASVYFTMAFSVVKHLLSGPTLRKIKVFGKDGWKEELLNEIDSEVLPAFLGGQRTDPDGNPLCTSIISSGGAVPERYFIKKKQSIANLPGVEKMTVTRKSKSRITLNVKEPGSHIEWEFETKNRDIGFSLLYKKNNIDAKVIEVIPKQRVDTNISSETGMYKCERAGIYIIEFDNTYSWIHQKEIYYRVTVVKNSITES